jgi:hypothetical protein
MRLGDALVRGSVDGVSAGGGEQAVGLKGPKGPKGPKRRMGGIVIDDWFVDAGMRVVADFGRAPAVSGQRASRGVPRQRIAGIVYLLSAPGGLAVDAEAIRDFDLGLANCSRQSIIGRWELGAGEGSYDFRFTICG